MLVLEEVDHDVCLLSFEETQILKKIELIFMGGISGLALGSLGPAGKTGDGDHSFRLGTPPCAISIFKKAVRQMVAKNPGKFEVIPQTGEPDPINDQWDKHATDKAKATLSLKKAKSCSGRVTTSRAIMEI
jgi:hypothetical protein